MIEQTDMRCESMALDSFEDSQAKKGKNCHKSPVYLLALVKCAEFPTGKGHRLSFLPHPQAPSQNKPPSTPCAAITELL